MNCKRATSLVAVVAGVFCFARIVITNLAAKNSNNELNDYQSSTLRSSRRALTSGQPNNPISTADIVFKGTNNNDPKHPYGECEIPRGRFPNHPVGTVYQPAFPGSGSRMTYELVTALTGLPISNDHNYNIDPRVHKHVVSVKTHYPNRNGIPLDQYDGDFDGAILIIRNPIKAIPSFFNFWYERTNHLENHSIRAPTEEWIAFRNANLGEQLDSWRFHMDYWLEKYKDNRSKLLVLPYEHLTDTVRGAGTALKLAMFLDSLEGVNAARPEDVACIWHRSVKYMDEGESVEGHSVRSGSSSTPYTANQFDLMRTALQTQKWKYSDDPEVFKIMDQYIRHIQHSWLYIT